jgi:hypothetical protein
MANLQNLLVILDGQHLTPGYMTPAGSGTALETVIAMMNGFNTWLMLTAPLDGDTALMKPAWIASLAAGQDAIFLSHRDGQLDLAHAGQPAFLLK